VSRNLGPGLTQNTPALRKSSEPATLTGNLARKRRFTRRHNKHYRARGFYAEANRACLEDVLGPENVRMLVALAHEDIRNGRQHEGCDVGRPRKKRATMPNDADGATSVFPPKPGVAEICSACPRPPRLHMPATRESLTHKFKVDGVRCYLIVGLLAPGVPGEIFLKVDKGHYDPNRPDGSILSGFADSWSMLFSIALQHGVPLPLLITKCKHLKFLPAGRTDSKDKDLRFADSIVDYVARWLERKYVPNQG
jgi:hypothetical protein